MAHSQLRFIVTNAPELDFDLIQEAWIDEQEIADVRQIHGKWEITFFHHNSCCTLSWKNFTEIYYTFATFIADQDK